MRVFQTMNDKSIDPKDIRIYDHLWQSKNKSFIPRTPVYVRVFQTLEVTISGSFITSLFVPITPVFVRVFQTLEVTIFGSIRTSIFIRIIINIFIY